MPPNDLIVYLKWDEDACVWYAQSEDVPGLNAEDDTLEGLIEEVKHLVPDLLRLNHVAVDGRASWKWLAERREAIAAYD
jgi:hypothetical protein